MINVTGSKPCPAGRATTLPALARGSGFALPFLLRGCRCGWPSFWPDVETFARNRLSPGPRAIAGRHRHRTRHPRHRSGVRGRPESGSGIRGRLAGRDDAAQGFAQSVVRRLEAEGRLADGWTATEAADFLWATTSTWTYQALLVERGWSEERLIELLSRMVRAALVRGSTQS